MTEPQIEVSSSGQAVAERVAVRLVNAAGEAIALTGRFTLALAGGSTPKLLYRLLATDEWRDRFDWEHIVVFFGDERTVGPDHEDSNFKMASDALLNHVPIREANVHRMRGELDPAKAASQYDALLRDQFGDDGGLDVCLLGMGDDGHTASLFPHTSALDVTDRLAAENHVEKLETWRLTMTVPFLNRSREVMAIITGASKATPLASVIEGTADPREHPIAMIQPTGVMRFCLDVEAAGMDADED